MCAAHPSLFSVSRPTPLCTFSEQHAFALAAVASQFKELPAACQPVLEAIQFGNAAET
ncbi:hypothetical protein [Polaromonas sp. CG9_12]|nr:hypothetical protein [Polaromonas sp. CG9_12]